MRRDCRSSIAPCGPPASTPVIGASPSVRWSILTSMSTYNGRVVIIGKDGTEIPVTTSLRSYRSGLHMAWDGTLIAPEDRLRDIKDWEEGRLRFPDGTEAEFLRPDRSDWVRSSRMSIIGQNDPPF